PSRRIGRRWKWPWCTVPARRPSAGISCGSRRSNRTWQRTARPGRRDVCAGGGAEGAGAAAPLPAAAARDPLGGGHPCTWRTLLIQVAAEVIVRTWRIVVRLSSSWPHLALYRRVCERLRAPFPNLLADLLDILFLLPPQVGVS